MARLPDAQSTLAVVERIASAPTAPYHERQVIRAIESELRTLGIATNLDAYGQLHARIRSRSSRTPTIRRSISRARAVARAAHGSSVASTSGSSRERCA